MEKGLFTEHGHSISVTPLCSSNTTLSCFYIFNLSSLAAEARETLWVQGQPDLYKETLSEPVRKNSIEMLLNENLPNKEAHSEVF